MYCPKCGYIDSKVVDSRQSEDRKTIRRRRECLKCKHRFTTYERYEETPLVVQKKDGTTEEFDREKILKGLIRAAEKRPVSIESMNEIVDSIEKELSNSMAKQVKSKKIGEMVMDRLKDVDEISYVRFASVYRSFKDTKSFYEELKKMIEDRGNNDDK
ncbi:transcriptional repressor NrdR [Ezakiella coagulans]|uniref:Transcriptional repressor NrdR n=1 Tax=Ezakiella coagulans TaxID=46507 RepID=A0A2U1E4B1_9FIRM|nr:transcriptional regulator NrdR [Ezakiella coagulans]KGF07872.1 NrdR family transcriptional regulator [Tissierellia bacterium S7-1-4]PVY94777.1 transcriptional repressor NrdR [Ezakiella coagulans]UQK60974.1 transcriptional regulator NrdR [Ezakiella coagulans]